tara:strand:+ start:643 stop:1359 length:717 start_codon:yes stop_codon:yes gene_type:complete
MTAVSSLILPEPSGQLLHLIPQENHTPAENFNFTRSENVEEWIEYLKTSKVRNLCDIPGHDLCRGNLKVPRNSPWYLRWLGLGGRMPQLPESDEALKRMLAKNHYTYGHGMDEARIEDLVPIQEEMNPNKVGYLLEVLADAGGAPFRDVIRVARYPGSKKTYVLDGHHRYAAYYLYWMITGSLSHKIPVYELLMNPIRHATPLDLIKEVNGWEGVEFYNLALISAAVGASGYTFNRIK